MAASAVIGALRVNLGLNSAGFRSGLDQSQGRLSRFGSFAKGAFLAVGAAAIGAAAAMGAVVKSAIDTADEISKMSQRVGVSVESLSRLAYAGSLADVSLDTLGTSFSKLAKNMTDIAMGKGAGAKAALDLLGVSAFNLDGSLRAPDAVLASIADRFATMPDGAAKTALAIQLFGRAGAEMIPMLNGGSAGLASMAAEADRLGVTLDTKSARAAEQFNDQITRFQAIFQGIANKIMVAVLPALNELAAVLTDPRFVQAATDISLAIVNGMAMAVNAITTVTEALKTMGGWLEWANTHDMFGNALERPGGGRGFTKFQTPEEAKAELAAKLGQGNTGFDAAGFGYAGFFPEQTKPELEEIVETLDTIPIEFDQATEAATGTAAATDKIKDAAEEAADAAKSFGERVRDGFKSLGGELKGLLDGTKTWNEALGDVLMTLGQMVFSNINFGGASQGGTNMFGDIIGGLFGGLFGFKDGGAFKVGGSGGIDSQTVAFNASPDEVVSITKPGQGEGGQVVQINQSFILDGAISDQTVAAMVRQGASQAVETVKRSMPGWQVQAQRNGRIS
jgi:hypothetical protein